MWPWLPSKLLIPSGKQAGVNLWRSTLSSKKWKTSRRPLRELKIWRKKLDWQNFDQVSVELCRFLYCQRHCSPDGQVSHPLLLSSCEKFIDICCICRAQGTCLAQTSYFCRAVQEELKAISRQRYLRLQISSELLSPPRCCQSKKDPQYAKQGAGITL